MLKHIWVKSSEPIMMMMMMMMMMMIVIIIEKIDFHFRKME